MDNEFVKFCSVCNKTKQNMDWCDNERYKEFSKGFHYVFKPKNDVEICPSCHQGKLINSNLTREEFHIIEQVSDLDRKFLEAMIKLKHDDIIEFQLKMAQFKTQVQQQEHMKNIEQKSNIPKCPHCQSTDIKAISGLNRGASIAMWGIFSKKINKSFECKHCGYTW